MTSSAVKISRQFCETYSATDCRADSKPVQGKYPKLSLSIARLIASILSLATGKFPKTVGSPINIKLR